MTRRFLVSLLLCVSAVPAVRGDNAPLSLPELEQAADLIVVGRVESLSIRVMPSRFESGHGNSDWLIDVTIKIESVEKGAWTNDRIDVRCFRVKSRASLRSFVSPSGHWPIPDRAAHVRAYLRGLGAGWEVVLPNGFSSPDADSALRDTEQLAIAGHQYAYLLPVEAWWLLALLAVVTGLVVTMLRRWARRNRRSDAACQAV